MTNDNPSGERYPEDYILPDNYCDDPVDDWVVFNKPKDNSNLEGEVDCYE